MEELMSHTRNQQLNYGLGQAKQCCNNKRSQSLWGLKQQRLISCPNYISIMSWLEGSVCWRPHSATQTDRAACVARRCDGKRKARRPVHLLCKLVLRGDTATSALIPLARAGLLAMSRDEGWEAANLHSVCEWRTEKSGSSPQDFLP